MVEKISSILTQRMVNENIISVNEYDYYHYKLLPAGSTYSFYAHSLNGNQIWGTASFGMR